MRCESRSNSWMPSTVTTISPSSTTRCGARAPAPARPPPGSSGSSAGRCGSGGARRRRRGTRSCGSRPTWARSASRSPSGSSREDLRELWLDGWGQGQGHEGAHVTRGPVIAERRAGAVARPRAIYLNTASFGLPPRRRLGGAPGGAGRLARRPHELGALGRVHRARPRGVRRTVLGAGGVGGGGRERLDAWSALVAASLPDGARVLSTEPEFTSALWPFMAQGRGIEVRCVPAGPAGRGDRRAHRRGELQRRAVVDRRAGRSRRDRRGGGATTGR